MSPDTAAVVTVPAADFTRFTNLVQQLGEATRTLAGTVTDTAPALRTIIELADDLPVADTLPGLDTGKPAQEQPARPTPADHAAYREQLYARINATGAEGATAADLVTGNDTLNRVQGALRTLEASGRVFRVGHGLLHWHTDRNRTAVINAMRRRLPNHDLTVPETATVLKVSETRVRELVNTGALGGRRVGRAIIVHRKALLEYIQRIGAAPTVETTA
ncbi:helix-turn-helix domain-containing protein [Planomonospora sp. ID82291]|uniref:helix-turn-helix domain-containing protein n=1 Tax=Planomonospora sp. ID82291 TaxID=2738136 RepID=UPI0018C3B516|nr:helix-turn-helix domain-containing protein [Planomonospora sp. ID82291]MBG0818898.1 helix-turn-helix domain-containing protein [Planomonospora sp. ID82291]